MTMTRAGKADERVEVCRLGVSKHKVHETMPRGTLFSAPDSHKCPECGKGMARTIGMFGAFMGHSEVTWVCLKGFGGCGHEEKVKK